MPVRRGEGKGGGRGRGPLTIRANHKLTAMYLLVLPQVFVDLNEVLVVVQVFLLWIGATKAQIGRLGEVDQQPREGECWPFGYGYPGNVYLMTSFRSTASSADSMRIGNKS